MPAINLLYTDPLTGEICEIQQKCRAVPRAGDVVFLLKIDHCPRQVVKQVAHVFGQDGQFIYVVLAPDQDHEFDELWSDALQ